MPKFILLSAALGIAAFIATVLGWIHDRPPPAPPQRAPAPAEAPAFASRSFQIEYSAPYAGPCQRATGRQTSSLYNNANDGTRATVLPAPDRTVHQAMHRCYFRDLRSPLDLSRQNPANYSGALAAMDAGAAARQCRDRTLETAGRAIAQSADHAGNAPSPAEHWRLAIYDCFRETDPNRWLRQDPAGRAPGLDQATAALANYGAHILELPPEQAQACASRYRQQAAPVLIEPDPARIARQLQLAYLESSRCLCAAAGAAEHPLGTC